MEDAREEVRTLAMSSTKYLVDRRGRKRAVLLNIQEYSRLLNRLEELEDTLDLDKAVRSAHGFTDYREIREQLRAAGRL